MSRLWAQRGASAAILLSVFGAGALLRNSDLLRQRHPTEADIVQVSGYQPSFRHVHGPQLAFVYIGSSTCPASNDERLPGIVQSLQSQVHRYATEIDVAFIAVGATIDWRVDRAYHHLRKIAQFDQLVLGGNWTNPAILAATWREGYSAAVPAIAVLSRDVETPSAEHTRFAVNDEHVVFYVAGLDAIFHQELIGLDNVLRQRGVAGASVRPNLERQQETEGT